MTTLRLACAALLALAAAGCASNSSKGERKDTGPYVSDYPLPGKRVYVEYVDLAKGTRTALVNRGSTRPADVYSTPRNGGPILKVATDANMADLCENFRVIGFEEMAVRGAPATPKWTLSLDVDGRVRQVTYATSLPEAEREKMMKLLTVYWAFFNNTLALQSVNTANGTDLFQHEQDRITDQAKRKAP